MRALPDCCRGARRHRAGLRRRPKLLTAGAFKSVAQERRRVREEDWPQGDSRERHRGALAVASPPANFRCGGNPSGAMAPLLRHQAVESSAKPLARVGIGVSIKQGAPVPDLQRRRFQAKPAQGAGIANTDPASGGTAGPYPANLFEKMGIAAELRPKTVPRKGGLVCEEAFLTGRGRDRHAAC